MVDTTTYCPTGKIRYESIREANREAANLNKGDKRHKHSGYKCKECSGFHTTTVTKRVLKKQQPKKMDKYPIKYLISVSDENPIAKKERINKEKKLK